MVAGLLFLALAFFAVGQAGATRNGAQSGADAAALAAAMESRDRVLGDGELDLDFLGDLLDGDVIGDPGGGCAAAGQFAGENETTVTGCDFLGPGRWGFRVTVDSQPLGETILPGTADRRAQAKATAVVEPLCTFEPSENEPSPGDGGNEPEEPGPSPSEEPEPLGTLHCPDGGDIDIDPEDPDPLPDLSELFTVRLVED